MSIIPADLVKTLALEAPAALGQIAFRVAIDTGMVASRGFVGSVRADMRPTEIPTILAREIDGNDGNEISAFESPDGSFAIVFSGEERSSMMDVHIVLSNDIVLKSADPAFEPFRVILMRKAAVLD